jgi:hypothetical protein
MKIDDAAEREGHAIQHRFNMPRIQPAQKSRKIIKTPSRQETARLFEPTQPKQLNDDLSFDLQRYLSGLRRVRN